MRMWESLSLRADVFKIHLFSDYWLIAQLWAQNIWSKPELLQIYNFSSDLRRVNLMPSHHFFLLTASASYIRPPVTGATRQKKLDPLHYRRISKILPKCCCNADLKPDDRSSSSASFIIFKSPHSMNLPCQLHMLTFITTFFWFPLHFNIFKFMRVSKEL